MLSNFLSWKFYRVRSFLISQVSSVQAFLNCSSWSFFANYPSTIPQEKFTHVAYFFHYFFKKTKEKPKKRMKNVILLPKASFLCFKKHKKNLKIPHYATLLRPCYCFPIKNLLHYSLLYMLNMIN